MNRKKSRLALLCVAALCASLFAGCSASGGSSGSSSASGNSVAAESAASEPPASSAAAPSSSVATQDAKTVVRVGTLQGPAGIGMVELMERNETREAANIYEFTVEGAPDAINARLISGDLDIAAVPTNAAAVLYGKTEGKVKIIAVSTLGVLYMLQAPGPAEEGEERAIAEEDAVTSIADLAGKTIYSTGQGATQEYVLNYLLEKNGITDAEVIYKSEHAELATLMGEGTAQLALLPQPFITSVTMKDDKVETVLDITKEWETASGGTQLTMGAVVVRDEFLEKNGAAVDKFLEEYKQSTAFASDSVDEAAALSGKYEIVPEAVAKLAIPHCNIVGITGEEMKTSVSAYLDVLFAANPSSVGGALPDEAFYYLP